MPVEDGNAVRWECRALGVSGVWGRMAPGYETNIYKSNEGSVDWCCVYPQARAELSFTSGEVLRGLGYVERLEMTIEPWKLPLEELHWGRFLSESASLVWIDWRGMHKYRLLLENGVPREVLTVEEGGIAYEGNERLVLSDSQVLRRGALGKTALSALTAIRLSFPAALLNIQECKWISRGELAGGKSKESGWAIHEVVRWPR